MIVLEGGLVDACFDIAYPFRGIWRVQNSPADRLPSHGTAAFASAHAIDFVPISPFGRSAPIRLRSPLRPELPDRFIGFGRPIRAPIDGRVIAAGDTAIDHHAHRGFPSIGYALTQRRRVSRGWRALVGNSTEPHLHIQAIDRPDVDRARAVPLTFHGQIPHNGEVIDVPE